MSILSLRLCRNFSSIFVLLSALLTGPQVSYAQFATAAAYPFTPSQKTFNYLASGTSVNFPSWDDNFVSNIPIGFTFNFCNVPYTTVTAHTNGYMCFGNNTSVSLSPGTGSLGSIAPAMIAFWHDASGDVNTSGASTPVKYITTGTAPNRVFILEFKNWGSFPYSSPKVSFQYILYEGGPLELMYKPEGSGDIRTMGIARNGSDYQSLQNSTGAPAPSTSTFNVNVSGLPASGQSYLWGEIPCAGVPTTAVVGPNQVCPGKPFTLTLQNVSLYSGLTYQWQQSLNGTTWATFTGTGTGTKAITDVISSPKWYRCIVTCTNSSQSFTTPAHYVTIAPFYYCYCDGSKATSTAAGIDVGNVTVKSLSNNSTLMTNGGAVPFLGNASSVNGYTDFRYSVPPIPMYHDSSYVISMSQINQPTTFTKAMGAVYIDFNRNGTFDVAERVLLDSTKQLPPFYGTITDTFKVPETAGYGLTGMRVILVAGAGNPDTCAPYTNGETEDYLVDLRYLPCSSAHAGTVMGDTSVCTGYDYILVDSTYQKERHGLSHFWQRSADAVNWVDIPGYLNQDTLSRVFTGQPLYYRVTQVCSHVNDTDRVVHKVNLKAAYKCYCFSQSLGGDKDTSDVGGFAIYNFEITDGGAHLMNPRAVRKRQDYTDLQPIEMWVDSVYQFRVFHTMPNDFHADGKVTVFMDFDNDRQYDLPGERVFTGFTNVGTHTLIKNIIIPDSVVVDVPTGIRVIVNNEVAPNAASDEGCGTYVSGETEDYMMIFRRAFPVGVQEVKGIEDVQLFPNPTSGRFTIHFRSGSAVKEVKIKVLSMTGQLVTQEVTSHTGGRFMKEKDLSNYAKGLYLVELDADGIKSTNRVVVR